jgi:hypothetical protein
MADEVELRFGNELWRVSVPNRVMIPGTVKHEPQVPASERLRAALLQPLELNAPLARAVTPDDQICIVVDERLPELTSLVIEILRHLQLGGVEPSQVTFVVEPPSGPQAWALELPDELSDVHVEIHDPEDPRKLAYLATTKNGKRIYLNRTVVEAGMTIVLSSRAYHPDLGYEGAEFALYPALSNMETREQFLTGHATIAERRALVKEIGWLLGLPVFVQIIEGGHNQIAEVIVGLRESARTGEDRQNQAWKLESAPQADLVIATLTGDRVERSFWALAQAARNATRLAQPQGRVVLLCDAAPDLDLALETVRREGDAGSALNALKKRPAGETRTARTWLKALEERATMLRSRYPDEVVEELLATPLTSARELQRLINAAGSVIILPDAHQYRIAVD